MGKYPFKPVPYVEKTKRTPLVFNLDIYTEDRNMYISGGTFIGVSKQTHHIPIDKIIELKIGGVVYRPKMMMPSKHFTNWIKPRKDTLEYIHYYCEHVDGGIVKIYMALINGKLTMHRLAGPVRVWGWNPGYWSSSAIYMTMFDEYYVRGLKMTKDEFYANKEVKQHIREAKLKRILKNG